MIIIFTDVWVRDQKCLETTAVMERGDKKSRGPLSAAAMLLVTCCALCSPGPTMGCN